MPERTGLVVTVEGGGLPSDVVERITAAVQETVRREVASTDLLSGYEEQLGDNRSIDFRGGGGGNTGGIAFIAPDDVTA